MNSFLRELIFPVSRHFRASLLMLRDECFIKKKRKKRQEKGNGRSAIISPMDFCLPECDTDYHSADQECLSTLSLMQNKVDICNRTNLRACYLSIVLASHFLYEPTGTHTNFSRDADLY